MNTKLNCIVMALLLSNTSMIYASVSDSTSKPMLVINLPSEATIDSDNIKLGQIADMAGGEEQAAKAKEIGLGKISVPGQKITIERAMITSRLASEKIDCRPVFAGAESVIVSQKASTISVESFVESATAFLVKNETQSAAKWEVIRKPTEMVLTNIDKEIELVPRLVSKTSNGQATVEINVTVKGKSLGTRQVTLDAKYNARRVVALTAMKAGEIIKPDNTRIETVLSDDPEPAGWTAPYGLAASRNLTAGAVIGQAAAKQAKQQIKVERNQNVVIKIDMPGLVVTATGQAMQQGAAGDNIKVRNIDSQRIILTKINEDGTVEPVY
jgi:flagella basal body P-ring formation protein FlgA